MTATTEQMNRPPTTSGPVVWLRKNLFNTWYNSLLTLVLFWVIVRVLWTSVNWIANTANWVPVTANFVLYMVGQYPAEQLWRIGLSVLITAFLIGASWRVWLDIMQVFGAGALTLFILVAIAPLSLDVIGLVARGFFVAAAAVLLLGYGVARIGLVKPRTVTILWVLSLPVIFLLLRGTRVGGLTFVPTTLWGGLLLNLLLAVVGIAASFPLGVALALGRRSHLPVVRIFSTGFIEMVRGVPLITILFMASIMLPLFLSEDIRIDRLVRALIGITLFSAAYMAENIRGGLQAIPLGQYDAAKAIGLNGFQTTVLIVLPQALRLVIPAIVGQFISLFKDTSLVVIVGLTDILGISRAILSGNPEWVSAQAEVYLFVAAVFWVFTYAMSRTSRRVEQQLGVGTR